MVTVKAISSSDRGAWDALWSGYLTFYEAQVSDEISQFTFDRIISLDGPIRGALAFNDHGEAVGLVHWLTHPATWSKASYCYLEDLFVAPGSRGAGAGKALIEHVESWARDNGCAKVYWLTAKDNDTAQRLYDRIATNTGFIHYQIPLN